MNDARHYTTMNGHAYDVFEKLPEGWRVIEAPVHPKGMLWICNNKSRFSTEYKQALLKQ